MSRVIVALALLVSAGAGSAAAHHADPPEKLSVIRDIYPDLAARASGPRLHRMVASRWWRTHPLARGIDRARARAERYRSEASRYRAEFLCIAGHESGGVWTTNTGNGYYGGLQMDPSFQMTYGPELYVLKGTADNWTADEQIAVASRAVASRGFTPWPMTARMCGLL